MEEKDRILIRDSLLSTATGVFYALRNCEKDYQDTLVSVQTNLWWHGLVYSPAHKLMILEGMIKAYHNTLEDITTDIPFTKDLPFKQRKRHLFEYLEARLAWSKKQCHGKKLTKFTFAYKKNHL